MEDDDDVVHPMTKMSLRLGTDAVAIWIEFEGGSIAVSARSDTLREMAEMLIQAADELDQQKLS